MIQLQYFLEPQLKTKTMLESTESLLPKKPKDRRIRTVLIGMAEHSLDELNRLLSTLDIEVMGSVISTQRKISAATYISSGKLEAVKTLIEDLVAEGEAPDCVIVDVELSPNQLRNIEAFVGLATLDRPGVILEIFYQHARTKEAKTQVELARLDYILPRLAHLWNHFERQRGGGVGNKGMGEKQLEVDRRLVKKRMQILQGRLKDIEKERTIKRSSRKEVLKVALVGYTNAGKSTLLNALTHSRVLAEDKLFATLDPSVRMLSPDSHPPVVAVDTVGFVSRLPHALVASFRSTLEEVLEADLLVHVVDGSSPNALAELKVTEEVLIELGAVDKPKLIVLNKMDLLDAKEEAASPSDAKNISPLARSLRRKNLARIVAPGSQLISAVNKEDVDRLRTQILNHFKNGLAVYEVVIPYSESKLEALIHEHGSVERVKHIDKGTFIRVRMDETWAKKLGVVKYQT
jgi:GTPase